MHQNDNENVCVKNAIKWFLYSQNDIFLYIFKPLKFTRVEEEDTGNLGDFHG